MLENNIGNYAKHAFMWDLYGPDNTEELEYWRKYAGQFGKNILIPMCAVGSKGAYLAECGFNVTAFDITPEMITEGQKRYENIENLRLLQGDIRDFKFDIPPADFCYCVDLGHIQTIEDIKKSFICINRHMRKGGGFIVETGLRNLYTKSENYPSKRFDFGEVLPGIKVWKINTHECRYEAENGRFYIIQEVYIEKNGEIEMFDHAFYFQNYFRKEWTEAFNECGFEIIHEYKNRDKEIWQEGDGFWIVEAIKK